MKKKSNEVKRKLAKLRPRINSLGIRNLAASFQPLIYTSYNIYNQPRTIPIESRTEYLSLLPLHIIYNMGWIPWSSDDSKKSSDGGRIAPDRTSRARCWEGRDLFFACLDRNDILDGIKDDKEARRKCGKEVEEFEAACSATWVCG